MKRRHVIRGLMGSAAKIGLGVSPLAVLQAANSPFSLGNRKFRRAVFFLQNQGFAPGTCLNDYQNAEGKLTQIGLTDYMKPLEPLMDKMQIVTGLHGTHTTPQHSAGFGALGGYAGGISKGPAGVTVDYELSQLFPKTIIPHLGVGAEDLASMRARPTYAGLSARGASSPIYMHSDPVKLYQMIYGSVAGGSLSKGYQAESGILQGIERSFGNTLDSLTGKQAKLFSKLPDSLQDINRMRDELGRIPDVLNKYRPELSEKFTNPEHETDWHDAILDVGISAMQANLTSVLTYGGGRGSIFGSYTGLGIINQGHELGHMEQLGNEIWHKIRNYNSEMLLKIYRALEATPEPDGSGNMMDHTLIIYTSNNADKQHTIGEHWPVVLIGNAGGQFKTNAVTRVRGNRPINDLYTTLLRAAGSPVDRFNLSSAMSHRTNSVSGPIEEILA